jgi:hypothetical protein
VDEILHTNEDQNVIFIRPLSNYALEWNANSAAWNQHLAEGGSPDDWETVGQDIRLYDVYVYNANTGENKLMNDMDNWEYRVS